MEAFEVSGSATSFPGEKDKLKPNTRCTRVEIEARVHTIIPPGQIAHPGGKAVVLIPDRDLKAVEAMVWDDDEPRLIEQAREDFELLISEETSKGSPVRVSVKDVHALWERARNLTHVQRADELTKTEQAIMAVRDEMYEMTGQSVESCFNKKNFRGIKPIVSMTVLETDVIPAELAENRKADGALSADLLKHLLESVTAKHQAEIAELRAEIRALKGNKK